jgi:carbamoyltransferase
MEKSMSSSNVRYSMGFMNYCSHDPGAALVRIEGNNMDYIFAEEGFLSRTKKSYQFPIRSLNYCLDYYGIKIDEVDTFVFDYMDYKRTYRTSHNYRLLLGDFVRSNLKVNPKKIQFIDSHHLAHAYTAFYPSGFEEATILIVDGFGSAQQTHSIFKGSLNNGIECVFEQIGNGIGTLYNLVTQVLGFKSGEEGKTMGLAPYGRSFSKIDNQIPSFKGEFDCLLTDYSKQLQRNPNAKLRIKVRNCDNPEEIYEPYFSRMAYKLQEETERCMLHLVNEAVKLTGIKNVCLAGGVALNCVANNFLQCCDAVENFYVQPASGDTGLPLGLALYGAASISDDWEKLIGSKETIKKLQTPYSIDKNPLGDQVDKLINNILEKHKIPQITFIPEDIGLLLSQEKIVSFFQDGIELGPRALGHRSFLADPRSAKMKEKMNLKIKHREGYRPFAPIILREYFDEYFISDTNDHPYMLQAPSCMARTADEAPAIVHVDNTGRVQTVEEKNGSVHSVIKAFHKITGTPILINTSFNDNNEPIVFTKLDALCCFSRTNADVLVINNSYILRSDIKDKTQFTEDCEKFQLELSDQIYSRALTLNTYIDETTSSTEIDNFLKHNLELSSYYRDTHVFERLIDFLQDRSINRKLILDEYHFEVLKSFQGILMGKIEDYFPNYEIVNDDLSSLNAIKDGVDLLLYNMSIYLHSIHSIRLFSGNKDIVNFYLPEDKLVRPYSQKISFHNKESSAMSILMNSYEHKKSLTIKEFFNKYDK